MLTERNDTFPLLFNTYLIFQYGAVSGDCNGRSVCRPTGGAAVTGRGTDAADGRQPATNTAAGQGQQS